MEGADSIENAVVSNIIMPSTGRDPSTDKEGPSSSGRRRISGSSRLSYQESQDDDSDEGPGADDEEAAVSESDGDDDEESDDDQVVTKKRKSPSSGSKSRKKPASSSGGRKNARKSSRDEEDKEDDESEMELDVGADTDSDDDPDDKSKAGGVISYVYVENFMNHKKMEVILNPSLNFITGKNGSGKSAIATALMICLGSRASVTGRGSALSGLIREGSSAPAKIRVCLRNSGKDAYMPNLYGKSIIVERIVNKTGSTLNLRHGQGKQVISTKRSDLDKILTAFDIRVDNPCCVLTQENSKKFIKGKEEDKYEFFMKATGLAPMWQELIGLMESYQASNVASIKGEGRTDSLRKDAREKKVELEKMLDLDKFEEDIRLCHAKAFWVDVVDLQDQLSGLKEGEANFKEAAEKAQEALTREEENAAQGGGLSKDELKEQLNTLNTEGTALDNLVDEKRAAYTSINKKVKELKSAKKTIQRKMDDYETLKAETLQSIEEKKNNAKGSGDEEKAALYDEQKQKQLQVKQVEKEIARVEEEMEVLDDNKQQADREANQFRREESNLVKDLKGLQSELSECSGGGASSLTNRIKGIGGPSLAKAAYEIEKQLKGKLVGPIGPLLSLKEEYKKYSKPVHVALNAVDSAFINVSGDIAVMRKGEDILRQCGARAEIINQPRSRRYSVPQLNYSDVVTVMDCLSIDHPEEMVRDLIYNVLVDKANLHGRIIVESEDPKHINPYITKANGKEDWSDRNVADIITRNTLATVQFRNGIKSVAPFRHPRGPKNFLVTNESERKSDLEEQIAAKKTEIEQHALSRPTRSGTDQLKAAEARLKSQASQLQSNLRHVVKEVKAIGRQISEMNENSKEDDTTAEEETLTEVENSLAQAVIMAETNKEELSEITEKFETVKSELDDAEAKKQGHEAKLNEANTALKEEVERRRTAESRLAKLRKHVDTANSNYEKTAAVVAKEQEKFDEQLEHARNMTGEMVRDWDGEPLHLERSDTKEKLQKKAEKIKKNLEVERKKNEVSGLTLDIAQERYDSAKAEYKKHKQDMDILADQLLCMKEDLANRKKVYMAHRKGCASRVDNMFGTYLGKKGFSGTVEFEHEEEATDDQRGKRGRLLMSVNKDGENDDAGTSDVRNLSGGERSFTTLALLLALGHVVDTPFRVMDEYDVFLDELARKVTLNQIVDYVADPRQKKKQFIIITPNNLKDVKSGNHVKIVKMKDPERRSAHGLQQQTID
jgi:chromosome segregation ATPase